MKKKHIYVTNDSNIVTHPSVMLQ